MPPFGMGSIGLPWAIPDMLTFPVAGTANCLYVAGSFTKAAGNAVNGVAAYDGNIWTGLGTGLGERDGRGYATGLAVSGDKLYAIGYFKNAGGKPSYRFAEWIESP
jgi:trimeric autotransporter adhesin